MTWGASCSNQFLPSGNGRDAYVLSSQEFREGRLGASIPRFGCTADGAATRKLRRPGAAAWQGPRAPSIRRLEGLHRGERASTTPVDIGTPASMKRSASDPAVWASRTFPLAAASQIAPFGNAGQRKPPRGPRERMLCNPDTPVCFFSNPIAADELQGSLYGPPTAGPSGRWF
mmetsp:Transcript_20355/g.52076  ORF Transcript_20355/g.52076 Transcript_20355/m.52076 type:complete len:173 (-) Transcript_20355:38-556(-)